MKTRMTHAARAELVDAVQSGYSAASGKAKRRILDEFIAASGYHEKSAIASPTTQAPKERQKRERPSLYDDASRAAPIVLWESLRSDMQQTFEGAHVDPAHRDGAQRPP